MEFKQILEFFYVNFGIGGMFAVVIVFMVVYVAKEVISFIKAYGLKHVETIDSLNNGMRKLAEFHGQQTEILRTVGSELKTLQDQGIEARVELAKDHATMLTELKNLSHKK